MLKSAYLSICQEIEKSFGSDLLASASDSHVNQYRALIESQVLKLDPNIQRRIKDEFFNLGPLELLIGDSSISEILVNCPNSIWFEKEGRLQKHDDQFLSDISYDNIIEKLGQLAGKHLTLDRPYIEGHFDGMRLSILSSEITNGYSIISIRKHPKNPWVLKKLVENKWCDYQTSEILKALVLTGDNFVIIGETGSGKTSVVNALLNEIPETERAVVIEDSSEVHLPNSASVKLLTRDAVQDLSLIDQQSLLKRALRLRPDRLVMGEIRGEESKDFLMLLATGHRGCFATLHAKNPSEALIRLEMLIQLGAPQWNLGAIRRLIFLSLQYILVTERTPEGRRAFKGLYKLSSLEESGITLDSMTSFGISLGT